MSINDLSNISYSKYSVASAPSMSSASEVASNSQSTHYGNTQCLQYPLAPNNNPNSVPPNYFPFVPPPSPPPPYTPSNLNELPYASHQYPLQHAPYPPPPPHIPVSQQISNPPPTPHNLQSNQGGMPQFSNLNPQPPYFNPTTQTPYPTLQTPYPNPIPQTSYPNSTTHACYSQPLTSNTLPQTPYSSSEPISPTLQTQTAIPAYPQLEQPMGFPPQPHEERSYPQETCLSEKSYAFQGSAPLPPPTPTPPLSGLSDYSPSCPCAEELDSVPDRPPRRRGSSRASSIGFEEDGFEHASNLYPSLSNNSTPRSSISRRGDTEFSGTTPLPPNLTVLWESSYPVRVYFIQNEGHVVTPDRPAKFVAYKSPPRYVVLILPKEITKEERQRLDVLLKASSAMTDEPSTIVDKFESGFGSVFDTITQNVGSVVKKGTPDLHKNTKWLRKTTGSLVRMGGSLVSKGVHLVSDNVMEKEVPKEASTKHKEIFEALKVYRNAMDANKVTRVLPLTQ